MPRMHEPDASAPGITSVEPSAAPSIPRAWHVAAVVIMVVAGVVNMRGWLFHDLIPPPQSDFPGYAAVAQHVRDMLLRYGRVPDWSSKWFAGTTVFLSHLKEYLVFPVALVFGVVQGIKLVTVATKIAAAIGFYAIFARLFRAPMAGLVAGYAYAFGEVGNRMAWRLDGALSYALFPAIFLLAVETLRRRRARDAGALGILLALQFDANYMHLIICVPMFLLLLGLQPWREQAGAEARPLDLRSVLMLGGFAAVPFLALAASQLAWIVFDARNHALFSEHETQVQMDFLSEFEPFLLFNRANAMREWLWQHRPTEIGIWWERAGRYLGVVAMASCLVGWFAVRRDRWLRRWYQTGLVLFALLYWLALGPWTLLGAVLKAFQWDDASIASLIPWVAGAGLLCWSAALVIALRSRHERSSARAELAFGLGCLLVAAVTPGFTTLRPVVPFLASVRSPGKFFDLIPFPLCLVFGVSLVGLGARLRYRHQLAQGFWLVIAVLTVVDFWPSTERFFQGVPSATLRTQQRLVERLPGEDGALRVFAVGQNPWPWTWNPLPWDALLMMQSDAGQVNGWLGWQAGSHFAPYLAELDLYAQACAGGLADTCGEPLSAIARVAFWLREQPMPPLGAPWTFVERSGDLDLWARPDVMPMASGYRAYALLTATSDGVIAAALPRIFDRRLALVSTDGPVSDLPADVVGGATLLWPHEMLTADPRWLPLVTALPPGTMIDVAYRRPDPEHIVLEADAGAAPALLFVAEAFHPWWRATVDGVPAPVLRAHAAFMSVHVGPGAHVVELRLRRPVVVAAADALTKTSWLGLVIVIAALGVRSLRTARARGRPTSPSRDRGPRRSSSAEPDGGA